MPRRNRRRTRNKRPQQQQKTKTVVVRSTRQPRRRQRQAPRMNPVTALSPCCRDYAQALITPWAAKPTCLPHGIPALPSVKVKYHGSATAMIGPNGTGFATFDPYLGLSSGSNTGCVSLATYTPSDINIGTVETVFVENNSQYDAGQMKGARVVAGSLRVSYSGKLVDRAGVAYILENPNHATVDTLDPSDMVVLGAAAKPIDGQTLVALWTGPKVEEDLSFENDWISDTRAPIGILFTGCTPGSSFLCQFDTIAEVILTSNQTLATASPADSSGGSTVATALRSVTKTGAATVKQIASGFMPALGKALAESVSGMFKGSGKTISRVAPSSYPLIEEIGEGALMLV